MLKDTERSKQIFQSFEVSVLINDIIKIVRLFERKMATDQAVREQFDSKIKNISLNIELIVKFMYYSPSELRTEAINLILNLLGYYRFSKIGIFAVYCVALKIQDLQMECMGNLEPVFKNEVILKELFKAVKDVDPKFAKLTDAQKIKILKGHENSDLLSKFESQSRANLSAQNKSLKIEQE